VIRLRPQLAYEKSKDRALGVSVRIEQPGRVLLTDPQQKQQARVFECDIALDSSDPLQPDHADQAKVFNSVGQQVVDHAQQGFNCCLCAYGQTGTGKTHTLHGEWSSAEGRGLFPRIAAGLLARLDEIRAEGALVRVQASFVEIYNNRLNDLLAPADSNWTPGVKGTDRRLQIHTHPAIGVYVDHLSQIPVQSLKDVARLMAIGDRMRRTATTSMNQRSSRSHTIFSLKLEVRNDGSAASGSRMSNVQVVDLAGRENEQTSECVGERFRELTFINRSLFQLANCVYALSAGNREHVPFRNSKLTMLLSESFQRNSRTYLLATLTPSASGFEENLLTCRFLESTGWITTQPVVNSFDSEKLTAQIQDEISMMRQQLGFAAMNQDGLPESAQLKSRLHLLNYLSGSLRPKAATDKPLAEDISMATSERERAQRELIADACQCVSKSLDSAVIGLDRLNAAHADVASSLGKAETQLSAIEDVVRELLPSLVLSPAKPPSPQRDSEEQVRLPPVSGTAARHMPCKAGVSVTIEVPDIVFE